MGFFFFSELAESRLELLSVAVSESVRWTLEQVTGRRRLSRSLDRRDFEEMPLKSAQRLQQKCNPLETLRLRFFLFFAVFLEVRMRSRFLVNIWLTFGENKGDVAFFIACPANISKPLLKQCGK